MQKGNIKITTQKVLWKRLKLSLLLLHAMPPCLLEPVSAEAVVVAATRSTRSGKPGCYMTHMDPGVCYHLEALLGCEMNLVV